MTLLCRAAYDNLGSLPQELTFKQGEILTILQQNPDGFEGWWICSLRGKVGIAPGNRLELLGLVTPQGGFESSSADLAYDIPIEWPRKTGMKNGSGHLGNKADAMRRSFYENCHDYVTEDPDYLMSLLSDTSSQRSSGISVTDQPSNYLVPPRSNGNSTANQGSSEESLRTYDSQFEDCSDSSTTHPTNSKGRVKLNVRFMEPLTPTPDTPTESRYMREDLSSYEAEHIPQYDFLPLMRGSTKQRETSDFSSSSTLTPAYSKSIENIARDYEDVSGIFNTSGESDRWSTSTGDGSQMGWQLVDCMNRLSINSTDSVDSKDLPCNRAQIIQMNREKALETFNAIQKNVVADCNKLFRFIHSKWKSVESLKKSISAIQSTCGSLSETLAHFTQFCQGAMANASEFFDNLVAKKIWKHLQPLEQKEKEFNLALGKLDLIQWQPGEISLLAKTPETDYLSMLVNATRSISIETRSLNTTIHGNSLVLFPNASVDGREKNVSLIRRNSGPPVYSDRFHNRNGDGGKVGGKQPPVRQHSFSNDGKDRSRGATAATTCAPSQSHTVQLYSVQIESHGEVVASTLEEFLKCISQNRSPGLFVAHSKFLLKCATQLIHIASDFCNTLPPGSRLRTAIENTANGLCDGLKAVIVETKRASAGYPSPGSMSKLVNALSIVRQTSFSLRKTVRDASTYS